MNGQHGTAHAHHVTHSHDEGNTVSNNGLDVCETPPRKNYGNEKGQTIGPLARMSPAQKHGQYRNSCFIHDTALEAAKLDVTAMLPLGM